MGTSVENSSSKSVIRLLQHSILQLCNEHVGYSNKLQIMGVLCMNIDDEPHELVVKVNNTLKRVASNHTPAKDQVVPPQASTTMSLQPPVIPLLSQQPYQPTPITITPIPPSQSVAQNLTKQFQHAQHSKFARNRNKSAATSLMQISSKAAQQAAQNTVTKDAVDSSATEDNSSEGGPSSGEKKSQGRKGRKPTKVHHVYDEGEFMSQEDEINDENVLTVIPTDPDHMEDMEPVQVMPDQDKDIPDSNTLASTPASVIPSSSSDDSGNQTSVANQSIMRQALEQGAAAALETARRKLSPYRSHPYMVSISPSSTSPTANKPSGSASIRALLQAQAHMRQQMRLGHGFGSPIKSTTVATVPNSAITPNGINSSPGSVNISPSAGGVELVSVNQGNESSNRSSSEPPPNAILENGLIEGDDEQEEALDFSSTAGDKLTRNESTEENLVIDERRLSSTSGENSRDEPNQVTMNGPHTLNVKEEPNEAVGYDDENSQSHLSESDLSQAVANASANLTSTPINYPFAGYTFVDRITGLPPTYPGINLSLAAAGVNRLSNGTGSPDNSGLTIQYTATGPITVGPNGQNVSNSPRVKDIIMFDDQSPLKQQKGNKVAKVVQEGDFMLDKLGLDNKRRRRRSPDETLTAEEIAEYMGATSLGTASGPNSIIFKCKYCNEEMEDLVRYLQHTLTIHNAYICHQCGKSFTTKSSLLRHRPIHTGLRRFACSICKKTFYRKDKCKSHIKRHLGPGDQNVDQYQHIEPVPEMPLE